MGAAFAASSGLRGRQEESDYRELQQQNMCCPTGYSGKQQYGDCSKFYECVSGTVVGGLQGCAPGTLFDGTICNWPWAVTCKPPTCASVSAPTASPTKPLVPTLAPVLAPTPPASPVASSGTKKFILRFDDVQDNYQSATQQSVIQWSMDNNLPISLGVIGGYFGTDTALVNKVQQCLGLGTARCEVFNHGWDAQTMFGTGGKSVTEIQQIISNVDNVIRSKLNGYQPYTMVPHTNDWGPNLLQALRNLGYESISASLTKGMTFDVTTTPMQMPQQTELAYYNEAGTWVGLDVQAIISVCEASYLDGDEACVIMAHPQEFASGQFTVDKLKDLTDRLKARGWTSHTFRSVAAHYSPSRPTMSPITQKLPTAPTMSPTAPKSPTASTMSPTAPQPPTAPSNRQYILRLDDIQDYFLSSTQQSIIQWCMDNNMAVSLGVIGGFFGYDSALINNVKACLTLGPNRCEVFNHGNDATNNFGTNGVGAQQIQTLLQYAHNNIVETLGYTPTTMVPHQNSWGSNLIQTLKDMNYNIISASIKGSEPMEL